MADGLSRPAWPSDLEELVRLVLSAEPNSDWSCTESGGSVKKCCAGTNKV